MEICALCNEVKEEECSVHTNTVSYLAKSTTLWFSGSWNTKPGAG